jgi:hypothetical protein
MYCKTRFTPHRTVFIVNKYVAHCFNTSYYSAVGAFMGVTTSGVLPYSAFHWLRDYPTSKALIFCAYSP